MFAKTYLSSIALALMHYETANGLVISYPEVIPGPGLPSLASLGLTSAELYNMGMPNISSLPIATRAANFNPVCGPVDFSYVNVNGIIACYHYLDKLGHQNCVTPEHMNIAHFCYAGDAEVSGQATSSRSASSYCSDVAIAVLYTVDHCTRPDQSVAGFQAANGNGDLIVGSTSKNYIGS